MSERHAIYADGPKYDVKTTYSKDVQLLFDLRKYMRVLTALLTVFVSTIIIMFSVVWSQLVRYDVLKAASMNQMNANIQGLLANTNQFTGYAVPISSNLQYVSNALVASVAAGVQNDTAVAERSSAARNDGTMAARHLSELSLEAPQLDEGDLLTQDYKLRKMVYSQTHRLLQSLNERLTQFNPGAVSDVLEWIVTDVNYTAIRERYDRAVEDIEKFSSYAVSVQQMVGLVSGAMNVSWPGTGLIQRNFKAQNQAQSSAPVQCA